VDYFLAKAGQKPVGPLSREQVRELLAERKYLITDLVWTAAQKDWLPVSSRLEFYSRPMPNSTTSIAPRLGYEPTTVTRAPERLSTKALYEAVVGPGKMPFYGPIFERLDLGRSPASWNLAAALATSGWMVYRRMYLWGLLWYPLLTLLMTMAVLMIVTQLATLAVRPSAYVLALVLLFLGSVALMGSYGNRLFHAHVRRLITISKELGLSAEERLSWLRRKGRPNVLGIVLVVPFAIAVVAAGAIEGGPAFRDFTTRSQVSEGLARIEPLKKIYLDKLRQNRKWPTRLQDLGLNDDFGAFGPNVASVSIGTRHEIRVTFSPVPISGASLLLVPDARGSELVWSCSLNDLPRRYAPSGCH